ncbi:MAG: hypothetical protein U0176_21770 [Bacteroidia bacterium]
MELNEDVVQAVGVLQGLEGHVESERHHLLGFIDGNLDTRALQLGQEGSIHDLLTVSTHHLRFRLHHDALRHSALPV